MFVGVDGCRAGWIAIGLESEDNWQVNTFPDVSSLWEHHRQASLILIDIPIGLKAGGKTERRCDPQARKLLGTEAFECISCAVPSSNLCVIVSGSLRCQPTTDRQTVVC